MPRLTKRVLKTASESGVLGSSLWRGDYTPPWKPVSLNVQPMKVVTKESIDSSQWDEFVMRHPLGTIYHHSLWHDVIRQTYSYQPLYHLLLNEVQDIVAAVPSVFVESWLTGNRIISYPFSDSCDPLVSCKAELDALTGALDRSRVDLRAGFFELRLSTLDYGDSSRVYSAKYLNHELSLEKEPDALFRSFHRSCIQRSIRKAQASQLEIRIGKTAKDLKAFYSLHLNTRRRMGVPVQPFRFFENLWKTLMPNGMLTLFLASHQGRCVATVMVLHFKNRTYYKYGASDESFLHLRANQLLMWEAICHAKRRGSDVFDFGRTSSSNKGLVQYKARWGTDELVLSYYQVPGKRRTDFLDEESPRHLTVRKLLSKLPGCINRVTGELLYRHFA